MQRQGLCLRVEVKHDAVVGRLSASSGVELGHGGPACSVSDPLKVMSNLKEKETISRWQRSASC